jgi:hypothetical protein
MFLAVEACLAGLAVAVGFIFPMIGSDWFEALERAFAKLARRRGLAIIVVGLTALLARAAVLPIEPVPEPSVHDEFSYLLMSDTFAHGRLANPTHPMWVHFESIAIMHQPAYVSMFYPAQGLVLALGQVIAGHPFWGVWLSAGLMCAAICWMLQGWVPARWALLGGFLAVMRLAVFSYWGNSYYGGTVAAVGGALVLGALPRLKRRPNISQALLMGLGLAILGNSRPYETLFLGFPVAVGLFTWMFRRSAPPLRLSLRRIVLPLTLLLAITGAGMLYYFWRATGTPFSTPYLQYDEIYDPTPFFPWQSLRPLPLYHHEVMRTYFLGMYLGQWPYAHSKPLWILLIKAWQFWLFFLGPVLTLPLLMLAMTVPYGFSFRSISSKTRFMLFVCVSSFIGLALPIYGLLPHYAAPLAATWYALLLQAMRYLRLWRWHGKPTGLFMVRAVPSICCLMLLMRAAAPLVGLPLPRQWPRTWCSPQLGNMDRAQLLAQLKASEGRHLVIVRYGPNHDVTDEWVYNEADIDHAKVIWARDMGVAKNGELLRYFSDRHVWLVQPDENRLRLSEYSAPPR